MDTWGFEVRLRDYEAERQPQDQNKQVIDTAYTPYDCPKRRSFSIFVARHT